MKIDAARKDEIGSLFGSLKGMVERLNMVVFDVQTAATPSLPAVAR